MLTLFHDYTSPASAVAAARLQRLSDEGVPAEFVGFEAFGVDAVLPVTLDVTAAVHDLADVAAAEGVALRRPSFLPPTGWAHVLGEVAEEHGLGASWRQECYGRFWSTGVDLSDPAVLEDLAAAAGLPSKAVRAVLAHPGRLATFRRLAVQHRRNGVGGVPTILVQRTLIPALLPDEELRGLALL